MLKHTKTTNQDSQGITKLPPNTIQLNIFSKVNPRNDGMLDSLTSETSEIKKNLDNESSHPQKKDQNQIPQNNIIILPKKNHIQIINRHTSPPLKNNFRNKNPRYNLNNFNDFVNNRNNTRTNLNVNKNLGNVYYGPNIRNINTPITKVVVYKRRNTVDCLDDDFCGIF